MAKKNNVNEENVTSSATNEWKTLHIFGYGETKLIDDIQLNNENNFGGGGQLHKIKEKVVSTSTLTKAQALIDFVYGKKPVDSSKLVNKKSQAIIEELTAKSSRKIDIDKKLKKEVVVLNEKQILEK
jgi:hypothetical protein